MNISIAVIIPVYNVENYLSQCLDSVVKQSIPFDEVILINDGSTDNSLAICKQYVSKYKYFKLIDQNNQGLSIARNTGMLYVSSEYIMFLDSDDFLRLDTVKILKEQLLKFPYDAVFFDADIVCEGGINYIKKNIYDRSSANLDGRSFSGWEYFVKCYPQYYVASSCMAAYKREMIFSANLRFPEGLYFEDEYFTLMFLSCAGCVVHISEKLYQRRYRENSITMSIYSERKFLDFIKCFLLIIDKIGQMKSCILEKYNGKILELISNGCNNIFSNYQLCIKYNIKLKQNTMRIFFDTIQKYICLLDGFCLAPSISGLKVLNKILINLRNIKFHGVGDEDPVDEKINEIINIEKKFYLYILKDLPLNRDCKIGIYGTGKHTEGLIHIFEKLIGKIKCKLVFLDSRKEDGWYRNWKIINYQRINDENLDLVVISSYVYEKEMISNMKGINTNVPLYTFYQTIEEDVFSEYKTFLEYCSGYTVES